MEGRWSFFERTKVTQCRAPSKRVELGCKRKGGTAASKGEGGAWYSDVGRILGTPARGHAKQEHKPSERSEEEGNDRRVSLLVKRRGRLKKAERGGAPTQ